MGIARKGRADRSEDDISVEIYQEEVKGYNRLSES